jgi:hypothetical protein
MFESRTWRFTGVYGESRTELRSKTWDALRYLSAQDELPWLCAGDFNEILRQEEQIGRNARNENEMALFRECLTDCRLTDLGYRGYDFTWDNRREGENNVQCRLDRATSSASFLELFPLTRVEHIATEETNHMALLIRVAVEKSKRAPSRARGFIYEEMWTKHESYEEMIREAWQISSTGRQDIEGCWQLFQDMAGHMKRWSFDTFGSVKKELKLLRSKLEEAKNPCSCLGVDSPGEGAGAAAT